MNGSPTRFHCLTVSPETGYKQTSYQAYNTEEDCSSTPPPPPPPPPSGFLFLTSWSTMQHQWSINLVRTRFLRVAGEAQVINIFIFLNNCCAGQGKILPTVNHHTHPPHISNVEHGMASPPTHTALTLSSSTSCFPPPKPQHPNHFVSILVPADNPFSLPLLPPLPHALPSPFQAPPPASSHAPSNSQSVCQHPSS